MMYGRGEILRIDLTSEKTVKEPLSMELREKYIGGEGINAKLLWEHFLNVDPKIDPLSPDNVLLIGMGPLAATGLGLGSRTKWTFKSPLTNMYGNTSSGGVFGCHLRWSGYDHVIITGKAKRPTYIWIHNDDVEIRDAQHLWGKTTVETDQLLKKELENPEIGVACIGQAGENLVRFASIMAVNERGGAAGRCGGGCVMGSKNLKALASFGTKGLAVSNSAAFLRASKKVYKGLWADKKLRKRWTEFGTLGSIRFYHEWGGVCYRNCSTILASEESWAKINADWYFTHLAERSYIPCSPSCAIGCGNLCTIKGDESEAAAKYAGERGVRPEYGNWASFCGACSIEDMPAMIHLTNKCNAYGMDTFEVGMSIALLMELWEKGIITEHDVKEWVGEPLNLEWGNWDAADKLTDAIGLQQNEIGQIFKDGLYQGALNLEKLKGVPVLKYANYGKGGASHEQTAKGYPGMAMAMAVAPVGAHHTKALAINPRTAEYFLKNKEAGQTRTLVLKGAAHYIGELISAVGNSLGVCWFVVGGPRWSPDELPMELLADALNAATGESITGDDLLTAGERLTNLCKAFNSRLGLRRADDKLAERIMKVPQVEGWSKGWKAEDYIEQLKDEYYEYHGWDKKTALPTRKKLEELSMMDIARVLANEHALV